MSLNDKTDHGSGRAKVLIVEDNMILAMTLEDSLVADGFNVIGIAADADEAIALAGRHTPDLAVMDIRLAGARDGIDAAIQLMKVYGVRSLFASAHNGPDMRRRAEIANPAGWITKPYTPTELIVAVRSALGM